jgi:hypothetical protein
MSLHEPSAPSLDSQPLDSQRLDGPALAAVLSRLATLEAESAVRKVMAAYMAGCDLPDGKGEAVAACFTDDGIWEAKGLSEKELGLTQGHDNLVRKFDRNVGRLTFTAHYLTNERVWVDGATARGEWMFIEPAIYRGEQAMWLGGRYENDFVCVDGVWKMSHLRCWSLYASPYEDGWLKTRWIPLP